MGTKAARIGGSDRSACLRRFHSCHPRAARPRNDLRPAGSAIGSALGTGVELDSRGAGERCLGRRDGKAGRHEPLDVHRSLPPGGRIHARSLSHALADAARDSASQNHGSLHRPDRRGMWLSIRGCVSQGVSSGRRRTTGASASRANRCTAVTDEQACERTSLNSPGIKVAGSLCPIGSRCSTTERSSSYGILRAPVALTLLHAVALPAAPDRKSRKGLGDGVRTYMIGASLRAKLPSQS